VSVRDLVSMVVQASGRSLDIVYDESKPTVKISVALDCRKAEVELGWRPQVKPEDGIGRTIAWWRDSKPIG
jgi:nucleoside-diphosphate-sugar epimerase